MKSFVIFALLLIPISISAHYEFVVQDTTVVQDSNITYSSVIDDQYIQVKIETVDHRKATDILRTGLTIYFDRTGKEKREVSIQYPLIENMQAPQRARRGRPDQSTNEPQVNEREFQDPLEREQEFNARMNKRIEELPNEGLFKRYDEFLTFHKALNAHDISVQYSFNEGVFVYHVKVPIDQIASRKNDLSTLLIGVTTTERPKPSEDNASRPQLSLGGGNQRGGSGGQARSGGGQGRGQGMQGGSGNGRGGQDRPSRGDNRNDKNEKIEFWFEAN